MPRGRSLILRVLAVALAVTGLVAYYVKVELAEPEAFADRGVAALQSAEVRAVIAEQVVIELLERETPNLVASRPLVLAAVEAILESDEFSRVLRSAAITAHQVLFQGDRDIVIELEEARELLVPVIATASPALARRIPDDLRPQIAEIRSGDVATEVVRQADNASVAAVPLLLVAAGAFGLLVALAPDRRRAAGSAGLALAAGAGLALAAMAGLRAQVVSHADEVGALPAEDARAAGGAAWDALAGGLEGWFVIAVATGLALWGGALLAQARVDRPAAARHAADIVVGGNLPRSARLLRGLGLAALGALVLLQADPVFGVVVAALGGGLALLGLAEALSVAPRVERPARRAATGTQRRALVAAAAVVALAGAGVGVAVIVVDGAPAPLEEDEVTACNGSPALCDRRLDEVVLAGTHNSMSAADRPGWYFANQTRPIPRQLRDGIRLLLLDPHYGVRGDDGRVRTDLRAEGTTRNRIAGRLGIDAVGAAEALAGRLGLVPSEGDRDIYLCHSLCELGAEPLDATLREIRGFLEQERSEVLVVFLESSVETGEIEERFEEAGLEPYLATLRRGEPLPTLREMITSGRRLVVFDERDGGDASWHQPGLLYVQTTSIEEFTDDNTSCAAGAGAPENPILVMNHWIDRFPPPPGTNREVGTAEVLSRRVRTCEQRRGRRPTMIAVDFYDDGDLIEVVRRMNRVPSG